MTNGKNSASNIQVFNRVSIQQLFSNVNSHLLQYDFQHEIVFNHYLDKSFTVSNLIQYTDNDCHKGHTQKKEKMREVKTMTMSEPKLRAYSWFLTSKRSYNLNSVLNKSS